MLLPLKTVQYYHQMTQTTQFVLPSSICQAVEALDSLSSCEKRKFVFARDGGMEEGEEGELLASLFPGLDV